MKKNSGEILVVGSYNVGLACKTERVPVWGETLIGSNYAESNGGKGANQAVAAARLGGDVSFIGCIGKDHYGEDALNMLKSEGVDVSSVHYSEKHTGVGFIFLNSKGENCILVDLGANNDLSATEVLNSKKIEESDIVIFQLENNIDTLEKLMIHAKNLGKTTIFNPAPANSEALRLLKYANIVNPNESELLILNGENPDVELTLQEYEELAYRLLNRGPEAIIVTLGAKGALVVTKESATHIQTKKVNVVDTTGAGDSFTGALGVALSEGKSLNEAAEFASFVGAYTVTKPDVIPAIPTREQLEVFSTPVSTLE